MMGEDNPTTEWGCVTIICVALICFTLICIFGGRQP